MQGIPILIASYAGFAAIATALNIAAQWSCTRIYHGPFSLALAMAAGTAIGLMVKYLLDKRWIFQDASRGFVNQGRKFSLYALMGVGTTVIFWATEYTFDALTPDGRYRYLGAVLGLAVGYVTKYFADRRFVFEPGR